MKASKYVKLGVLVVFSSVALIWGLSYLKGRDFFKPVNYFYAKYERVDGLQKSSHITMNGFKVGSVKNIAFMPDKTGNLLVTFMMDNDFKIPVNSAARIISSDIMGTRSIKLVFSNEDIYYMPGDTISGSVESDLKEQVSLQVLPLKNKAEELLGTLDSALVVLTVIFNEDARKNLSQSFENINRTIRNIEKASADLQALVSEEKTSLGNIIGNMEGVTGTFKDNSAQFGNVIQNLSSFSDSLAAMPLSPVVREMSAAVTSLQQILTKVNSDENTAGLLLNDDILYKNLLNLTANLNHLFTDLRNNPKRYVHFSAFDWGKQVYVNTADASKGIANRIEFKVQLISSTTQISTDADIFKNLGEVEMIFANNVFTYFSGKTSTYYEAQQMLNVASINFPQASIVAFQDGKIIKLEKALRLLK